MRIQYSPGIVNGGKMDNGIKARMIEARTAIADKDYGQAKRLLHGIEHETAQKWRAQIERIEARTRWPRRWRRVWGFLIAITVIGMCAALSNAALTWVDMPVMQDFSAGAGNDSRAAGSAVGFGLAAMTLVCLPLPLLLVFVFFWWRCGIALRK